MLTVRRILGHRALLWVMTSREIKARYRGSVLGFLWSLMNPLLLLGVYSFVFSLVFRPRMEGASPYPLFLISGLFPWMWASASLLEGTLSLTSNSGLIRRSVFPVELLPLVPVLSNLVNFLLSLPIIALGMAIGRLLGFPVSGPWAVLLLPVVLLQLPLLSGLSLGLAALAVHFKDVRDIVTNLLTLCFFLTPILYSLDAVPYAALRWLIRLNPFTPYVIAYQDVLFRDVVPAPALWAQMGLAAAVFWGAGAWLFDRLSETLIEAV